MGLLDEAIREHLELKRRRGADVAEVAREEREALGPTGRPEPAYEQPPPDLHVAPVDPVPEAAEEAPYEAPHDVPQEQTEPPRPHGDPADALPDPPAPAPAAAPAPSPPPPAAPPPAAAAQPTREFDLDEVRAASGADDDNESADDAAEAEDVLEETPEFLQETPEHDRLWFEQRPPRDFDF
jgi:hypothetical protein